MAVLIAGGHGGACNKSALASSHVVQIALAIITLNQSDEQPKSIWTGFAEGALGCAAAYIRARGPSAQQQQLEDNSAVHGHRLA